jgi:hypothetical protein
VLCLWVDADGTRSSRIVGACAVACGGQLQCCKAYESDVGVMACEQGALKVSTRNCLQKMADGMWCSQP